MGRDSLAERHGGRAASLTQQVIYHEELARAGARVRQRLAEFRAEAEAVRLIELRQLTARLKGRPPGPESSIPKLTYSELNVRVNKFAMELLGPYAQIEYRADHALDGGRWLYRMLAARGLTIAAGTSEIQKNIIGERMLGLPKG